MRIASVLINNYKSIGTEKNCLLLEDDVTALIGKNDCGKSNVLEILGAISFSHYILEDFYKYNNGVTGRKVSLIVELKFTNKEIETYKSYKGLKESNTLFYFSRRKEIKFTGGFARLFEEDLELNKSISYLKKELLPYIEINFPEVVNKDLNDEITLTIDSFQKLNNTIFIRYKKAINKILYILNSFDDDYLCVSEEGNKDNDDYLDEYDIKRYTLIRHLEIIKSKIRKKYSLLPVLYHRKSEDELQSMYQIEEVKKEIKDKKGILYKFIVACEVQPYEFLQAMEDENDCNTVKSRNKIKEKVKYNIQKKFNDFYTEENVQIKVLFEKNLMKILVKTQGNTTNISERSNGLRWYLNLFIDIIANDLKDKNVVFLLDEPGVYLHVNAQRELLRLFYDLCKNDNQVVYTTHSPYMIDSNNIINIRAVEKDSKGVTNIYNTAYDNKLNSISKRETLTPMVKAIGADLRFNIGPQGEKLNIVTEGITDYMYFTSMLYYLDVPEEKMPYIIPSVGAGNVNVVVSILIGWGCDYKVILDYDKAGFVECDKLIEYLNLKLGEDIFFVNCKESYEYQDKDIYRNPEFVECLISEEDRAKFSISYLENKTLAAKEFYDKVKSKQIELSDDTVNRFTMLFSKMGIL